MASRSLLNRSRLACSKLSIAPTSQRRCLATPSIFAYHTSQIAGINVAVKDTQGPTTRLAIVAKAGTRYEPLPGLAAGLEEFAFKSTSNRSAIRICRESELLGGQLSAYHTREILVIAASFLRADLPYFMELLAEVILQTKYTTNEFHEQVEQCIKHKRNEYSSQPSKISLDLAHMAAFHSGLGAPIYPQTESPVKSYLNEHVLADFSNVAFAKRNAGLVIHGASSESVSKWTEQFFSEKAAPAPNSNVGLNLKETSYYGGEYRQSHLNGNAMVIAFPGFAYNASKPELSVLAALLGGQPTIKWSQGFATLSKGAAASTGASISTFLLPYSDAGLLAIQISGSAKSVRGAALDTSKALKMISEGTVSKEDLAKAIAKAKFDALDSGELREPSMTLAGSGLVHQGIAIEAADFVKDIDSVTAEKLKTTSKSLLDGKASVSSVGDLFVLPFAEELGLRT